MALVECPECKENVSDKAIACPRCGFPSPGSKNPHFVISPPPNEHPGLPEYYASNTSTIQGKQLRFTSNRYLSFVDAIQRTHLPIQFMWEQALNTQDYIHWLGLSFPSLPPKFTVGTVLDGREVKAVVSGCQPGFSFSLHYDVNGFNFEFPGNSCGRPSGDIRFCLEVYYPNPIARMFGEKKLGLSL